MIAKNLSIFKVNLLWKLKFFKFRRMKILYKVMIMDLSVAVKEGKGTHIYIFFFKSITSEELPLMIQDFHLLTKSLCISLQEFLHVFSSSI